MARSGPLWPNLQNHPQLDGFERDGFSSYWTLLVAQVTPKLENTKKNRPEFEKKSNQSRLSSSGLQKRLVITWVCVFQQISNFFHFNQKRVVNIPQNDPNLLQQTAFPRPSRIRVYTPFEKVRDFLAISLI